LIHKQDIINRLLGIVNWGRRLRDRSRWVSIKGLS
jgi:hypothetical protein